MLHKTAWSTTQHRTGLRSRPNDLAPLLVAAYGLSDRKQAVTAAELRLLPMLCSYLSFREIGKRLYLSPNTIKSQSISIYRKLRASSRSEAVHHAQRLGLLGR